MVSARAASCTPSRFDPSFVVAPSPKTAWQHAVAQADLPFHTKGILLIVATEWMGADGGSCFPTEKQIIERAGISRPCLTRHMRIAVERGFIERWNWGHGNRNRRYNYRAVIPGVPAPEVEMGNEVSDLTGEMGNEVSDHEPGSRFNHDQKPESAPPTAAPPEPAAATPNGAHSKDSLRNAKTPPPDCIPDGWMEAGRLLRPDLSDDQIKASAETFLDYQRSKGTMLADWIPAWRNWIRRERGPKTAGQRPQATQPANRYPRPDQPEQPPAAAVQAAIEAGEQRRIAMMISCGIDPATGLKATPPAATPAATPAAPPAATEAATAPATAPADSPPLVGLYKPIVEPPLTAEDQQRQRQIADLAAQGLTLADARAARTPVRLAPTPPTPARRYTPEQQRQFIQLAAQGLSPAQIRARMRLD